MEPIQRAFIGIGAVQCGYCIPGMVLSAKILLDQYSKVEEAEAREGISGNLCRCTGYEKNSTRNYAGSKIHGGEEVGCWNLWEKALKKMMPIIRSAERLYIQMI